MEVAIGHATLPSRLWLSCSLPIRRRVRPIDGRRARTDIRSASGDRDFPCTIWPPMPRGSVCRSQLPPILLAKSCSRAAPDSAAPRRSSKATRRHRKQLAKSQPPRNPAQRHRRATVRFLRAQEGSWLWRRGPDRTRRRRAACRRGRTGRARQRQSRLSTPAAKTTPHKTLLCLAAKAPLVAIVTAMWRRSASHWHRSRACRLCKKSGQPCNSFRFPTYRAC